ncbi:MAG: hypothetical protein KDH96_10620 [Candidatus Riesia sp.]|nr:hypothetical protein [Candidatus Riesia sp.]
MFRYIKPIILAGGKSKRFVQNKMYFFVTKNLRCLEWMTFICFDLGFHIVLISGNQRNYISLIDKTDKFGALNIICTISKYTVIFLILPVDMILIDIHIILKLFLKSGKKCSYMYSSLNFPLFVKIFDINKLTGKITSLNRLDIVHKTLNFFLIKKQKIKHFQTKNFLNINTILIYFSLKNILFIKQGDI